MKNNAELHTNRSRTSSARNVIETFYIFLTNEVPCLLTGLYCMPGPVMKRDASIATKTLFIIRAHIIDINSMKFHTKG